MIVNLRDIVKWMGAMQRNLNMNMFGENGFTRQKVRAKYFVSVTDAVRLTLERLDMNGLIGITNLQIVVVR